MKNMEQKADVSKAVVPKAGIKVFTLPNMLSFFRLCLIPVMVWLYCAERNYPLAGSVLILSGLTDIVDGFIARTFNMISDLGKILDPIADKLTQGAMLLCLLLRFPLMRPLLILILAKEIFMSITGLMVIKKTGSVYGAKWHGKAATCLLYATMLLHVFWNGITPVVSAVSTLACAVMVAVSFILYGSQNIKKLKSGGGNME